MMGRTREAAVACILAPLIFNTLCDTIGAETTAVRVAPIAVIDGGLKEFPKPLKPELDLLKRLEATPLGGSVEFSLADKANGAPVSFLDAARLCELGDYPCLIYGYLRKQDSIYASELKVLSREGKRIEASFVGTDDEAHYDRLVADMAGKIADYFLTDLAMAAGARRREPAENLFELPLAAGYWIPAGEWSEGLMGLFSFDAGLRFVPRKPLGGFRAKPFYAGVGLWAEYALGKNKPGCETAYLHRIQARLPFEIFLGLEGGSAVGLAFGGIAEFDILRQRRKYGGTYSETTTAGGMLTAIFYRYPIGDRIALGLELEQDIVFYDEPLYTFAPRLRFEYSFTKQRSRAETE